MQRQCQVGCVEVLKEKRKAVGNLIYGTLTSALARLIRSGKGVKEILGAGNRAAQLLETVRCDLYQWRCSHERASKMTGQSQEKSYQSKRECRLFGVLLERLVKGPSAYVILDSEGHIDIESIGWSQVPPQVRSTAVDKASELITSKRVVELNESIADCQLHIGIITVDDTHWGVVSLEPRDNALMSRVAYEDTRPLCHWEY